MNQEEPGTVDQRSPGGSLIVAVYAAAIVIRLVLAFTFGDHAPRIADAQDYDRLAVGLLESGAYLTPSGEPSSLRPPLYPVLVAGVYAVFGTQNYVALSIVQSVISLLTMGLVHDLGRRLVGPRVGLLAAAIAGFYPSLLAFNCLVLSETLFTFLFTLAVWCSVQMQWKADWRLAIALGAALGLGALTRSILWVCAVPVVGYGLLFSRAAFAWRLRDAVVTVGVFAAILAPWTIRNTRVQETFTVVDVMGGRNVMMGNYEHTPLERSWATVSDVRGDKAWHRVLADATTDYGELTQGQIDKRAMRYGLEFFFTHPVLSAKRCVVRFFNFWQLDRTILAGVQAGLWGETSKPVLLLLALVFCGSYAAVILSAVLGFFAAPLRASPGTPSPFPSPPRSRGSGGLARRWAARMSVSGEALTWRVQGLILLWILIPCAIHTAAFAHSRYHLPLIPVIAVYAATALLAVRLGIGNRLRKALLPAGIVICLLVLGWIRELVMVDLQMLL